MNGLDDPVPAIVNRFRGGAHFYISPGLVLYFAEDVYVCRERHSWRKYGFVDGLGNEMRYVTSNIGQAWRVSTRVECQRPGLPALYYVLYTAHSICMVWGIAYHTQLVVDSY